MKCRYLLFAVFNIAFISQAAQFQPTTGGNLDNSDNWNTPSDNSFAIMKAQSAPLTISSSLATLPNPKGNLSYRNCVYTNEWPSGWKMYGTGTFEIQSSSSLLQKSGTLSFAGEQNKIGGIFDISGQDSVVELGTTEVSGSIKVSSSATFKPNMNLTIKDGGALSIENANLYHNTGDSGPLYRIKLNSGGVLSATSATITLPTGKSGIEIIDSTAVIDGSTLSIGNNGSAIGGDSGTILFCGNSSTIDHRFTMAGDDFTFCVSNTTVNFTPKTATDLFITGTGSSDEEYAKKLRFCGAAPRLTIASSNGFHLRGSKGVTLQFDIGKDGFPTDKAIVEITEGGSFKGDKQTCQSSKILVNVLPGCKVGAYTLLKGKNAATFLTGDNKWIVNNDRAVISAKGNDEVIVTIKPIGFALIIR